MANELVNPLGDMMTTLTDLANNIAEIETGLRWHESIQQFTFHAPGSGEPEPSPLTKSLNNVYTLLSFLLIDGTNAEQASRCRVALAAFVNAYANPTKLSHGEREAAMMRAFLMGCGALGVKPPKMEPIG